MAFGCVLQYLIRVLRAAVVIATGLIDSFARLASPILCVSALANSVLCSPLVPVGVSRVLSDLFLIERFD